MLSNRELATLIWLIVVIIICLITLRKSIFTPLINLLKALWKVFCMPFALIVNSYVALIFCLLWYYNILETDLVITFIFWIILFLYPSINIIYSKHNSLSIDDFVKSTLSLNIIFVFLVNQYTFPLWFELLLVPILFFLGLMSGFTKKKAEYSAVNKISNYLIMAIGVFIIFNVAMQLILNLDDLTSLTFWKSFAIEFYVLLHLPLLYFVKYYGYYEKFKIQFSIKNYYQLSGYKIYLFAIKILVKSGFNVGLLNNIWEGIRKDRFRNKEEILAIIDEKNI